MRTLSVRGKLMLLYLLVTFAGLLLFSLISYGMLQYALVQGKKVHLEGRESRLIKLLRENKENGIQEPLDTQLQNYALITHEGYLFNVHSLVGGIIFPADGRTPGWKLPEKEDCSERTFYSVTLDRQPVLVMCHRAVLNGKMVLLHFGGSLDEQVTILHVYRDAILLILPALLMFSSIGGYFLSRHALRPVDQMTKAALGIGIGNLSERLPVPVAQDEVQYLALAWNQLLARLEAAVKRLSQFSADASHDLRTSITVILATAQLALHRHRSQEEYRENLERITAECRTASTLLDAILALAQSDNFVHEAMFRKIDLCGLVISGCRRVEDLAESSGIVLDWTLPQEPVFIQGDEMLLQRLLGILLDNAIRYTPEDGEIKVEVSTSQSMAAVIVRDTGVGMSIDVQRKIFARFYQADLRERKSLAGNGLGLSIGKWIADAHGATLTVESAPRNGSVFKIQFPVFADGA